MVRLLRGATIVGIGLWGLSSSVTNATENEATVVKSRWGLARNGATRVVFQTDRAIDYLTVELAQAHGFEVHLMGTSTDGVPGPISVGNGVVDEVRFHAGPAGLVARIVGSGARLSAKSFTLENPHRVVVDVRTQAQPDGAAGSSSKPKAAAPVASRKTPEKKPAKETPADPPPAEPETKSDPPDSARVTSSDEEFDELLSWVRGVKLEVEALVLSDTEEDRATYRRSLAFLLAERGVLREAEKALVAALSSEGHDRETAYADSIYLAELRLQLGDRDGASEVARGLRADAGTPGEQLRLARVLMRCRFSHLAQVLLESAAPELSGRQRDRADLFLAQCLWDQKDPERALATVERLTASSETPADLLPSAVLLHADCLWALGRTGESKDWYELASRQELTPEEASWTMLQLGNVARREGRVAEARAIYRDTSERWPDTFYGSQAGWFLKIAEETGKLQEAEVLKSRG